MPSKPLTNLLPINHAVDGRVINKLLFVRDGYSSLMYIKYNYLHRLRILFTLLK